MSYSADVKRSLLGVGEGPWSPLVPPRRWPSACVGHSEATSAWRSPASPVRATEDGVDVGTVFVGLVIGDAAPTSATLHLPGDRRRIREYSTISALDVVRRTFDGLGHS